MLEVKKMNEFIKKYKIAIVFFCTVFIFAGGLLLVSNLLKDVENTEVVNANNEEEDATLPVTANNEDNTTKVEEETLTYPFTGDASTVRYYYDASSDQAKLAASLDYFENTYRPSVGMSFALDSGESFDVIAMLSGTVTYVEKDSIFSYCITIESDNGIFITYQSLGSVNVKENDTVKQGDVLGLSGENIYQSELGNHVHVILEKNDKTLNVENYFNKLISDIE